VTLIDGTEIEGKVWKQRKKKKLLKEILLKTKDGKSHNILAKKIKSMYLPRKEWDELEESYYNFSDQNTTDVNFEHLKNGYVYFLTIEVFL